MHRGKKVEETHSLHNRLLPTVALGTKITEWKSAFAAG